MRRLLASVITLGAIATVAILLMAAKASREQRPEFFLDDKTIATAAGARGLPVRSRAVGQIKYEFLGRRQSVDELIGDPALGIDAFVVVQNGSVVFERYGRGADPGERRQTWSVTKAVISALVGIAIDAGQIESVDDSLTHYVPELGRNGFRGVTIRDVLAMSSGVNWSEHGSQRKNIFVQATVNRMTLGIAGRSFDQTTGAGSIKREFAPGTRFKYASVNTQALGWVLERATGRRLYELVEHQLWRPLGMGSSARMIVDGGGRSAAFCCLYATARDLARFGLLYARGGRWRGRQIVPRAWVRMSTAGDQAPFAPERVELEPGDNVGFGLHWWVGDRGRGDFAAFGYLGQQLYVSPRDDTVVVRLSRDPGKHQAEVFAAARAIAKRLGRDR